VCSLKNTWCGKVHNTASEIRSMLFDLPDALLVELFSNWTNIVDVVYLDTACCSTEVRQQLWRIMSSKELVLNHARLAIRTDYALVWLTKRMIKLTRVNLRGDLHATVLHNFFATVGGDHMHTIDIFDMKRSTASLFATINATCKRIFHVLVEGCSQLEAFESILMSSLATVNTIHTYGSAFSGGFKLPSHVHFPSLRFFYIDCSNVEVATVVNRILRSTSCVERVCLTGMRIHGYLLNLSRSSMTLRELSLFCCDIRTDHWQEIVSTCTNLTMLQLQECSLRTESDLLPLIAQNSQLESLLLNSDSISVTASTLLAIGINCGSRLRHLYLDGAAVSGATSMKPLVEFCCKLQSLGLRSFRSQQAPIAQLITAQDCLRELSLNLCDVEGCVFLAAAKHALYLTYLELDECTGVNVSETAEELWLLTERASALETFRLGPGDDVSKDLLRELLFLGSTLKIVESQESLPPCWSARVSVESHLHLPGQLIAK
jgi:hypothetical protein